MDGQETEVDAMTNQLGRVELTLTNEGEPAEAEAIVTLYDDADTAISSRSCAAGVLKPGATKDLDTDIFVPAGAERASTSINITGPGRTVTGV